LDGDDVTAEETQPPEPTQTPESTTAPVDSARPDDGPTDAGPTDSETTDSETTVVEAGPEPEAGPADGSNAAGPEATADVPRMRTAPVYQASILHRVFRVTGRISLAILSVVVLSGAGYAWATNQHINNGIATTNVIPNSVVEPTTQVQRGLGTTVSTEQDILLVGMDSRTDSHGNPLPASEFNMLNAGPDTGELDTDTMILVHVPAGGGQAVAISFPRDAYVQLAGGFGKHRLNSAFAYAHNAEASQLRDEGMTDSAQIELQADEAGRKNLIATIETLIGNSVTINRYAEINLLGFYDISNAVGGVQVCLNAATHDSQTGANFPAGEQTISGVQALNFVRQRHGLPRGDLDRIVRQQVFLGALADKILSAGILASPSKLDQLITSIEDSVTISSGWDILSFAAEMQGLSSGNIEFVTIPTGANETIGGADVTAISTSAVQSFVQNIVTNGIQQNTSPSGVGPNDTSAPPVTANAPKAPDTANPPSTDPSSPDSVITADGTPCVN
jgi:LCP family protein required for cell wall assembly